MPHPDLLFYIRAMDQVSKLYSKSVLYKKILKNLCELYAKDKTVEYVEKNFSFIHARTIFKRIVSESQNMPQPPKKGDEGPPGVA